MWLFEVD